MPVIDIKGVPVATYFGTRAVVEYRARDQLDALAGWPGVSNVAGFADLHPGRHGPVGAAMVSQRLYPLFVGGDIGCGILCARLSKPARRLSVDKAVRAWTGADGLSGHDWGQEQWAREAGLSGADAAVLGTIGGGNHFCELSQVVWSDPVSGLAVGEAVLLVHSGSRGLGEAALDRAGQVGEGLDAAEPRARAWLADHDKVVVFARENRAAIAARAAGALGLDWEPVADVVHNGVEAGPEGFVHRKGAARALDALVPVAGSRETLSFLVAPHEQAPRAALQSLPHGAGRRFDRASCHGRFSAPRREKDGSVRLPSGGRVVCDRKELLIEESGGAYKDSAVVAEAIAEEGLGRVVAQLKPMLTYKTSGVRHG